MTHRKNFFIRRILLSILSLAFILGAVEATLAERVDSGVPGMIFEQNVPVTMTDGVALRVNIYRPEKAGHYPVLMSVTNGLTHKLRRGSSARPIIGIWKGVCITEQSRLWPPHSKQLSGDHRVEVLVARTMREHSLRRCSL
jgi:hypothetical protein